MFRGESIPGAKGECVPPMLLARVLRYCQCAVPSSTRKRYAAWGKKLTRAACNQTIQLRICSHRAAGGDLDMQDGALEVYRTLWKHGIKCFDTDFVLTADKRLIATHPEILAVRYFGRAGAQLATVPLGRSEGMCDSAESPPKGHIEELETGCGKVLVVRTARVGGYSRAVSDG